MSSRRRVSRSQGWMWFLLGCALALDWLFSLSKSAPDVRGLLGAISAAAAVAGLAFVRTRVAADYRATMRRGLLGQMTQRDRTGSLKTQLVGSVVVALYILLVPADGLPVLIGAVLAAACVAMAWTIALEARNCEGVVQNELDAGLHADAEIKPNMVEAWQRARPYQRVVWSAATVCLGLVAFLLLVSVVLDLLTK